MAGIVLYTINPDNSTNPDDNSDDNSSNPNDSFDNPYLALIIALITLMINLLFYINSSTNTYGCLYIYIYIYICICPFAQGFFFL